MVREVWLSDGDPGMILWTIRCFVQVKANSVNECGVILFSIIYYKFMPHMYNISMENDYIKIIHSSLTESRNQDFYCLLN